MREWNQLVQVVGAHNLGLLTSFPIAKGDEQVIHEEASEQEAQPAVH